MKKDKGGHKNKKKSVLKKLMMRIKIIFILILLGYIFIMNRYSNGGNIKITLSQNNESTQIIEEVTVKNFDLTVDTDLTIPSNVEAEDINKMLSGTALEGLGEAFVKAEEECRS